MPSDWRKEELKDTNEALIIKRKGHLKMIPKKKGGLDEIL